MEHQSNIYTPSYLKKLEKLNEFVRARIAEGYQILEARLLPRESTATVRLNRNYVGEHEPWINVLQGNSNEQQG